MSDRETIEVYNREVKKYADVMKDYADHKMLQSFIAKLVPQAKVLDFGCGTGEFSAHMRDRGLEIDPVDAASEMVKHVSDTHGLKARVGLFEDLNVLNHYDGVWASFSLLHATRESFPLHLGKINAALKENGLFYIGMKLGKETERDNLGRFYTYYEDAELRTLIENAGFTIVEANKDKGVGLAGNLSEYIELISRKA